ncbi:formate dehydrogenase subunit gamma [Zoogloea sp.]|uniref:formate dehydrogenase subunit gamma n=1 Tax=Zoogloea sp. TaxID=49181 RepID=UPI0025ED2426|nr:formate dehydrogenase subunit gamma [Zoogloea sp.]MCK6395766.1 formate dehydrogenase subunit gamma [Zoogloea sp.]
MPQADITSPSLSETAREAIQRALDAHASRPGALLPILHAIQDAIGWVPAQAVPLIATALNQSRAEIHGVISFYHHFRSTPPGHTVVQVCRAESCQARGGAALEAHAKRSLGIDWHETTADGAISLEPVYCLGNCACSPSIRVGDEILGRVSCEGFDALVDGLRAGPARPADAPQATSTLGGIRIFVPLDSGALAVGADEVAQVIAHEATARGIEVELIRNGSRGLYWLEPLVEVETPAGRLAYGPVTVADVPALFDAGFHTGGMHRLGHGLTEHIPFLAGQERLTFRRVGITAPLSLDDYLAHGGFEGLRQAVTMDGAAIVKEVTDSGLRGRGGAAFPTGIKWNTVLHAAGPTKYVVCNADEGDSGTFSDRMLMEGDPYCLIEGMAIAGLAVGAAQGYIYLRSEYPHAFHTLQQAIALAREAGWLGQDVAGSGRAFELDVRLGAGAYVCGEETAMLESLEGKRGVVRFKPPLPAIQGLFGKPTVINNVMSLAAVPLILARGAAFYRDYGMGRSHGTLPFQLAGNLRHPGLVEKAFGITLRELLLDYGGSSASGRPIRAVQVGGPLGAFVPESQFDVPLDYETYAAMGAMIGHGGLVAFDDSADMAQLARYAMEFCATESCGKCTPCRIGSTRGVEVIDRIIAGEARDANVALLDSLCDTMLHGSLCALGGMAPYPVKSALTHFPQDFGIVPVTAE